MADHNKPTTASPYVDFVTELDSRLDDIALGLDPAYTTATNVPTNSVRFSSAAAKWQRWSGTAWVDAATTYAVSISGNAATVTNGVYTNGSYSDPAWLTSLAGSKITGNISGNAGSATKLATIRTINGVNFDGSANISVNTNNAVTFSNGGSGAASGVTFNGGSGITVSYNTIGAPSTTGANASGTWGINITGNASTVSNMTLSFFNQIYPVGSVYINATDATNPATIFGFGTWVAFGAGRVPVGFDSADTLFNSAEKTGGSKDAIVVSHTHTFSATTSSAGEHSHSLTQGGYNGTNGYIYNNGAGFTYNGSSQTTAAGAHTHTVSGTTSSAGASGTNANIQPYITVYMWKRTA